jgi:hypothetical protein
MTDDNRQAEIWTYGGVRINAKGQRIYAWIDARGETLYFKKFSAGSVGGHYSFDVLRNEDSSFQSVYGGTQKFVSSASLNEDTELVARLQMEHRLANAELSRHQQERKAAAEPDAFEMTIQPLRDLRARSCRTFADRTAFLAMVIDALGR